MLLSNDIAIKIKHHTLFLYGVFLGDCEGKTQGSYL